LNNCQLTAREPFFSPAQPSFLDLSHERKRGRRDPIPPQGRSPGVSRQSIFQGLKARSIGECRGLPPTCEADRREPAITAGLDTGPFPPILSCQAPKSPPPPLTYSYVST